MEQEKIDGVVPGEKNKKKKVSFKNTPFGQ